jgi:hypothetical protein
LKKYLLTILATFFTCFSTVWAIPPDTLVVAGKQYKRGFFHRLLWGKHYREVWAEPVNVPFLNLQTEAGGLKPVEKGGSYQTKNLRMVNPQGQQYVLRSVDKDPSQTLSESRRKSFVGRIIRDQTSVVHPYGAIVVPSLADAAGIYHASPRYFVVPDDPALGEFRPEFANMLVMLEQRPEGNWENNKDFGRSEEIVSSKKAFHKLLENNKNKVDARAYLRARLFDMWLGDWSRREDQWRWATYKMPNGSTYFKPIPRDRDHAFFKFNDGFVTWLASLYASNLQTFGPKIKNLKGLNSAAEPMDKSLLVFLTKEDFKQIGDSLKTQLTDPVIENALKQWPENIYKISGKEFEKNLKKRRNQLPEVAEKYYKLLAKNVELPGTDKKEIFRLTGQEKGLLVEMLKPGKKEQPDSLIASRIFYPSETKCLKIYGLGEEDLFEIKGAGNPIKKVIIYDGAEEDKVTFDAKKKRLIQIMDSGDGNEIPKTKKIKVVKYQPKANEFNGEGWLLRHRLN